MAWGGESCGELAAEIAVNVVTDYLAQRVPIDLDGWPFDYDPTLSLMQNRVMNGVRLANRQVWETSQTGRVRGHGHDVINIGLRSRHRHHRKYRR